MKSSGYKYSLASIFIIAVLCAWNGYEAYIYGNYSTDYIIEDITGSIMGRVAFLLIVPLLFAILSKLIFKKSFASTLFYMLVFVSIPLAIQTSYGAYIRYDEHIKEVVADEYEKLKQDASRNYPDLTQAEAIAKEGKDQTYEAISLKEGKEDKMKEAVPRFFGFYYINIRSRKDYCEKFGVKISRFVKLFSEEHAKELNIARKYYSSNGKNSEELWNYIEPQLANNARLDMEYIAGSNNMTTREACEYFNANAPQIIKKLKLSKSAPEIYNIMN